MRCSCCSAPIDWVVAGNPQSSIRLQREIEFVARAGRSYEIRHHDRTPGRGDRVMRCRPVCRGQAGCLHWEPCGFPAHLDARGAGCASARATAPRPSGRWHLRAVLYRPDRVPAPAHAAAGAGDPPRAMAGAMRLATATTTGPSATPIRPAPSGCGARTGSTTSSSCWTTTTALACAAAAAPSSCTWPGPDTRRPRAASPCARGSLLRLLERVGPGSLVEVHRRSATASKKTPEAFASGASRSTYRGSGVLRQCGRGSDGARAPPQT